MIALVERLIVRNVAYLAEDHSVYFATAFPATESCHASTRAKSKRERGSRRTTTRRRTRRTSRSGRRPSRRTRRPVQRGIHPGAAGDPAGISSARRWRSTCSGRRSTFTRAGSI
jgi:hypothetical protein